MSFWSIYKHNSKTNWKLLYLQIGRVYISRFFQFLFIMKKLVIFIFTVFLSISAFAQVDSIYIQRLDKIQEIQLIREQINSLLIAPQNPHLDREIYKSLVSELLKKEEEYYNFLFLQILQSHSVKWIIRFNLEE